MGDREDTLGPVDTSVVSYLADNVVTGEDTKEPSKQYHQDLCLFVAKYAFSHHYCRCFGLFSLSLPSSFSDDELQHHLRSLLGRYGTIHCTKAARDKKRRPYCFVQFQVGP